MTCIFEGHPKTRGLNSNQNKGPHLGSSYIQLVIEAGGLLRKHHFPSRFDIAF